MYYLRRVPLLLKLLVFTVCAPAALLCGQTIGGLAADKPVIASSPALNEQTPPSAKENAVLSSTHGGKPFLIGAEDVLYIRVMHEPDLTGPQDVRPDGMIDLQLIGQVKASGLTPEQLANAIRDKLTQTIRNPEVSVQISKVNSQKFTIQGEVNRPGTYPFATSVTVLEALVNGMGFRDFANVKKIYVLRNGARLPFNYKEVSRGKHMEENVVVQNGDQIFVP